MILITSFGEFLLYFIVIFYFQFIKKKKKVLQDSFCVALFQLQDCISSGFETYKASSLGSVGKLTERKWNPHMESNTVRRVTLELT